MVAHSLIAYMVARVYLVVYKEAAVAKEETNVTLSRTVYVWYLFPTHATIYDNARITFGNVVHEG